jgi:hypothetical protein
MKTPNKRQASGRKTKGKIGRARKHKHITLPSADRGLLGSSLQDTKTPDALQPLKGKAGSHFTKYRGEKERKERQKTKDPGHTFAGKRSHSRSNATLKRAC